MAKVDRPRRTPINGSRNILKVNGQEPGFVYRVVNDTGDRVQEMIDRGYEIVTHDVKVGDKRVATPAAEGSPTKVSVGQGVQGYVMRIREDWYKEDQDSKQAVVNETEATMKAEAKKAGNYGKIEIKN